MKLKLLDVIGRGGFGEVERVSDDNGNVFARKTFRPASHIPSSAHEQLRKRFRREVAIQAQLGGEEIMPVIDSDLASKDPWFLMPLAEKTYESQIAQDRATGSVDIDAIADILNGLQLLHDLGYVHRDLNPKNVLRHEGHWKLSDLGAVLPPSGQTVTLTEDTVIYTEQYCAPEQRNSFHAALPSADIYSFGCILHDIFGKGSRIPYGQQSADGPMGILIEKCTETNPARRPTVSVLRGVLLDTLVDIGGHCKVLDHRAEHWLGRLPEIASWNDDEFNEFARFFAHLDTADRSPGHETSYVHSLSTPFLTRLPTEAVIRIVARNDGIAGAIVEKYCQWARDTAFSFHFADTVCVRLCATFDSGNPSHKALALMALLELAHSHHRFYVMRCALQRCSATVLNADLERRIAIEIRTETLEYQLGSCVRTVSWDVQQLANEIKKLL